jgi:hypothetical protein
LALASTLLSLLYVTIVVSVPLLFWLSPFLLTVVFLPTTIAVVAVVFVALLLPSGNGDGKNARDGKGNEVAGNKEGDSKG